MMKCVCVCANHKKKKSSLYSQCPYKPPRPVRVLAVLLSPVLKVKSLIDARLRRLGMFVPPLLKG